MPSQTSLDLLHKLKQRWPTAKLLDETESTTYYELMRGALHLTAHPGHFHLTLSIHIPRRETVVHHFETERYERMLLLAEEFLALYRFQKRRYSKPRTLTVGPVWHRRDILRVLRSKYVPNILREEFEAGFTRAYINHVGFKEFLKSWGIQLITLRSFPENAHTLGR